MQPNLDPAWTRLRDQLVAAGGTAKGAVVLLPRANRAVVIAPATIAAHPCVAVIAPIGRAHECDMTRALLLANQLEIGSMIVAQKMLALRQTMPIVDVTLEGVLQLATVLATTAQRFSLAVAEPSRTRSIAVSSAFAHVAE